MIKEIFTSEFCCTCSYWETRPDLGLFVTSRKPNIKLLTITNYKGVKSPVSITY